jgi:hypothetical protein
VVELVRHRVLDLRNGELGSRYRKMFGSLRRSKTKLFVCGLTTGNTLARIRAPPGR